MLAIVWHSRTGAAEAMACAAAAGAGADGVLFEAACTSDETLAAAQGYLFVCPENLGTMSGMMKDMFDRTYYPLLGRLAGRPYATMIAAGSDGHGAERQIDTIATGWRLRRVAPSLIVNLGAQSPAAILATKAVPPDALAKCRELGETLAQGLKLGIY